MTTPPEAETAADYAQYRPLMFSIAYRMTGSISDAEDIVQEAFLRLTRALREGTRLTAPKAYLATVTTRLAISHLRSARVRREAYVGTWLPEPLVAGELDPVTPAAAPDPAERAEMSDSLSMAFLVLLESLSPTERAVFLLHEVFGYDYKEIAQITGKSEANSRQIFARARRRVDEGKPRFEASREQRDEVARRFFDAAGGGDLGGLLEILAPDVVMMGDGGGKGQARLEPTYGPERVARFLLGLFRRAQKEGSYAEPAFVNGQPGAVAYDAEGRVVAVFALDIADGQVQAIRSVVNPDKLRHLGPTSGLYLRPDRDLPWRSWPPTSPRRPLPTRSSRASRTLRTHGCGSCWPAWSGTCTPSSGTPSRPSPNGSGRSSSSPRRARNATTTGRNSSCCPTYSASPCWWRR
jgi:RNA polymerase sigma-70 factor (ECF subfamily)